MARHVFLVCLAWLVYGPASVDAQEGRLGRVRNEVRNDEPSYPQNSNEATQEEEGVVSSFFGSLLSALIEGAWNSRHEGTSAPYESDHPRFNHFVPYPYCGDFPGHRVPRPGSWPDYLAEWDHQVEPMKWAARLSLEDGNDFAGLNRVNGQLLLETAAGIGVLTSWNHFYERLNGCGCDELVIGDCNLIGTIGCGTRCTLRGGLGFRTMIDHGHSDWGINAHVGFDFFPVRPVVVSISGDVGNLGDAAVWHTRATLGVVHRGWEIFGGYDALGIGSATLHGPLLGVRFWF